MSTLPDVTVEIEDGTQGLVNTSAQGAHVVFGTAAEGVPNRLYSYSSISALVAAHKAGPGVEACAHSLAVAGGPIYFVPLAQTSPGSPGAVTQTGSGPTITAPATSAVISSGTSPPVVTLSGTPTRFVDLKIAIVVGGPRGTATCKVSIDGGTTFSATQVTAATVSIPGTGLTINFPTGTDYATDNVYRAVTSVPNDSYEPLLEIESGGALGTATFRYTVDALDPLGAPVWSATLTTPVAASPTYTIPDTGISFTFASGTYVAGTTYALLSCVAPAYTSTEVLAAFAALVADPREWACTHLVGQAASTSGSASMASALDTLFESAENSFRFAFGLMEATDDEAASNANLIASFANFASTRVDVAAGFVRVVSPISGRSFKRNCAFPHAARVSKVSIGTDLARVRDGACPGVTYLYHDEQVNPGLDASRFSTMRTLVGRQGFYPTNGRLMAPAGSDFVYVQYRRVMDVGCSVGRNAALEFLNDGVRINRIGGTIDERDARTIESYITSALSAALTQTGQASAVSCVVDRTTNIQQTQMLWIDVRITPLGYAKSIGFRIGFSFSGQSPK